MKIMALNRQLGTPIITPIIADLIPDSAIIKDRKPFFVPDFSKQWNLEMTLAYRIARLGKNVAEKYAHRYYDAMTLILRAQPLDLINQLNMSGQQSAISTAFDGAIIQGQWLPIPTDKTAIDLTLNGELYDIDLTSSFIDNAIAQLSSYFTLKIGDIIIAGSTPHNIKVEIDSNITATLNGIECLNFKIK